MHTISGFMAARHERDVAERAALDEQIWGHPAPPKEKPKPKDAKKGKT